MSKKLETKIETIVRKGSINKILKQNANTLQTTLWLVRFFMKNKPLDEQKAMEHAASQLHKKHKLAVRQKLHRIKTAKNVIKLQQKYPNLKITEGLQFLSLHQLCELHKITNVRIFEDFLSVLFNENKPQ